MEKSQVLRVGNLRKDSMWPIRELSCFSDALKHSTIILKGEMSKFSVGFCDLYVPARASSVFHTGGLGTFTPETYCHSDTDCSMQNLTHDRKSGKHIMRNGHSGIGVEYLNQMEVFGSQGEPRCSAG